MDKYGVLHDGFKAVDNGKTTPTRVTDAWIGFDFVGSDETRFTFPNQNRKKDVRRVRINQQSRAHASTRFQVEYANNNNKEPCGVSNAGLSATSWTPITTPYSCTPDSGECTACVFQIPGCDSRCEDSGGPMGWYEMDLEDCSIKRLFLEQDQSHHNFGNRRQHYSMWERFKFRDDSHLWGATARGGPWPIDTADSHVGIH